MAKKNHRADPRSDAGRGKRNSGGSSQKHLDDLANSLLIRHLQESWPEPREAVPGWFGDETPPGYSDNLRIVAVVGAGASYPMESIAVDLADDLEKELDGDNPDREVELDRLENVYGLDRKNFETRLTAICRTPEAERKVRERISERYRHRHPSLLTYELLAHLLHHNFLDTIISFNFDELLDQAIDDELGPNEYKRVVTERDCDPIPTSVPLYIKMHGTASEPDSLRFTRERYYWTPKSIIELVERQFEVEHLVVMNVGFTMSSFDFQYLLRKPEQLRIYHLDPIHLTPHVKEEIERQREKEREQQKRRRPTTYDKPSIAAFSLSSGEGDEKVPPDQIEEDFLPKLMVDLIWALRERCRSDDAGPAAWRSTQRHKAVVEILAGSSIDTPTQYASYLRRRTILEFAFAAARGRGVLSISSMVDDRCGRYYDLYQRAAGENADSWLKLCEAGGLRESQELADTYEVLEQLYESPLVESDRGNIHKLQPPHPGKLAAYVMQSMNVVGDPTEPTKLLVKTLEFLQRETEIEVHSRDDRVCSKTFVKPVILKTFTALQGWTHQMLTATDEYNELWAVSETGNWLADKRIRELLEKRCGDGEPSSEEKSVRLLAAFEDELPGIEELVERRLLPWGRHNRHMTIICRDRQPRAAIYFVRRLRAPTVTPVYLSHQKDLQRIAEAFEKLWEEAGEYAETQHGPSPETPKPKRRTGRRPRSAARRKAVAKQGR